MRMMLWLLAALAVLGAGHAEAACTVAPAVTGGFGSVTSYDVRSGVTQTVAVPTTLACNGSIITLLSGDYARMTATSANGFRLKSASGDSIGYRLSADSAGTVAFTQGSTVNYFDPALLSLLTVLGSTSFVPSLYTAVTETPNVAAGTYTDTVTAAWSWRICHGIGVGGVCLFEEVGSATSTITVTLVVTQDCRIIAPPVAFGSAPLAGSFASVTQAVAVDCTKGSTYKVAFTSGASGTSRPWRAMSDGAGHSLQYNLYRADGTTIWDETTPLTAATPGTGTTTPTQLYPYVARINPQQAPVAGSYSDVVSVVVTF